MPFNPESLAQMDEGRAPFIGFTLPSSESSPRIMYELRSSWSKAYRGQDAEGYGEVECRTLFPYVGGGEVDRNPSLGEIVAAVLYCRPDPLLTFPDGPFGEPDGVELREAEREVYLDFDQVCVYSQDCARQDLRDHSKGIIITSLSFLYRDMK